MKKIFTFIIAATLCVGAWGTPIQIGTYNSNNYSINFPMVMESNSYGSLCQMLYLASEANISDDASRDITGVSFYFKGSTSNITRNVEVWLMLSTSTSMSSDYFLGNSSSKNAGTKVFDGQITLPTGGGWYDIHFNVDGNTAFTWTKQTTSTSPKTYNLVVTIFDKTATKLPGGTYHYTYTATAKRGCYKNGTSVDLSNIAASKAYDVQGSRGTTMPLIKLYFAGDDPEPTPTPSLTATSDITDFGTFAKEYETQTATITVTGENLTEDVTISAGTGLSVTPTSLTKEAVMAQGGATVTVTTTADFVSGSKVTISGNDIEKKITLSGIQATFETKISVQQLANTSDGSYSSLAGPTEIKSVDNSTNTFVIGSGSYACTIDYSAVPGTYVALGKVSNLKVKKTGTGTFKAFAFDYSGPVVTVITIDEDADNSETLAEEAKNVNVTLNRAAFQKNMFNTFCVPFDISEGLIGTKFAGCEIITLASSTYNDGVISLTFEECDHMKAGKPYLINPKNQDISFTFNGCNIQNIASDSIETELVDFIGIVNPTELPHSKEILFMGLNNELFWPTEAGTLKGLRCYFKVKFEGTPESSPMQGAPVRMTINRENTATRLGNSTKQNAHCSKMIHNGRLIINRNGKMFNIQGIQL